MSNKWYISKTGVKWGSKCFHQVHFIIPILTFNLKLQTKSTSENTFSFIDRSALRLTRNVVNEIAYPTRNCQKKQNLCFMGSSHYEVRSAPLLFVQSDLRLWCSHIASIGFGVASIGFPFGVWAGCGIRLYRFLIVAFLSTLSRLTLHTKPKYHCLVCKLRH